LRARWSSGASGAAWSCAHGFWIDVWCTAAVFHFVCLAWIFFRAETVSGALGVLRQLTTLTIDTANLNPAAVMIIVIGLIGHYLPDRLLEETRTAFTRLPALGQGIALLRSPPASITSRAPTSRRSSIQILSPDYD
jgi:cation transport ATPase